MLRVAMISRWHVHADSYAREAQSNPDIDVVAAWDEDPERGRVWAKELGVKHYANLDELLSSKEIDAVIVDSPTSQHAEILRKCASYGKHIFSEKVLTATAEECDDVFRVVDEHHVKLLLSLPQLTQPAVRFAEEALREGWIGKLTTIRCRRAHGGAIPHEGHPRGWLPDRFYDFAETCGGAMIDLGAHPIYLTNRMAGKAKAVTAHFTSYFGHGVDDNSAMLVEYESGALGIVESGFTVGRELFQLELHGTEGCVLVEDTTAKIRSRVRGNDAWEMVRELPAAAPAVMQQWVNWILRDEAPLITREDMRQLTVVNEAAAAANAQGRRVEITN